MHSASCHMSTALHVCGYSLVSQHWTQICVPPRPSTWEPQRSQQWQMVGGVKELQEGEKHSLTLHSCKNVHLSSQSREGMEARAALSCSGALMPAAPVAGDNWGRDRGILCACQSCAIATRADGAGTARRDLPVRQVNTQSLFKALPLNTLTGSPSTQSHVWTVGKFGLRPSLEAALKIQRGCSDSVSFGIAWPRSPAPAMPRAPTDTAQQALPRSLLLAPQSAAIAGHKELHSSRQSKLHGSNVLAYPKLWITSEKADLFLVCLYI